MRDTAYSTFLQYCTEFLISSNYLWHKDSQGEHKLVILPSCQLFIIISAYDDLGHHGFFAKNAHIVECFWWPYMQSDIAWFICTCHLCQTRKTQNVLIP